MNIDIQQTKDYNELASLNEIVQAWHNLNFPEEFKPFNLSDIEQAFKDILVNPNFFAFVARSNGKAIGYLIVNIKTRPESAFQYKKTILNIDQIAVAIEHQKAGIGQLLLNRAFQLAGDNNISTIQVDHWSGNKKAERLFVNSGFVHFNFRMEKLTNSNSGSRSR